MVLENLTRTIAGRMLAALLLVVLLAGCGDEAQVLQPNTGATAVPTLQSAAFSHPPTGPVKGMTAPPFKLNSLAGGAQVDLLALRGRPVWLTFWTTWCELCQDETEDLARSYEHYKGTDLAMVGLDMNEDPRIVSQFVAENKLTWTFAVDRGHRVSRLYAVPGTPTHVFIDRNGVIADVYIGELDFGGAQSFIDPLLAPAAN